MKTFSVIALVAAANLWAQDCESCRLEPVGVAAGQTVRLKVSARAPHSCAARLGFLDEAGKPVGPTSHVTLQAGQSTTLDVPSSAVLNEPGQRAEIQPQVVPDPGVAQSDCQADAAVIADKPSGGPREGVKVHGHWTIDVRNTDGTLASHREFENSLTVIGGNALVNYLGRSSVMGLWQVLLGGTLCPLGIGSSLGNGACFLDEPTEWASGPNVFKVLTVSIPQTGPSLALVLAGSFLAPQTGVVNTVATQTDYCNPGELAVNCTLETTNGGPGNVTIGFTSTTLVPAVSVTIGQLVQVTVAISFS